MRGVGDGDMIDIREIHSIEGIWSIVSEQKYRKGIDRYRSSYLYRGLPNVCYALETSLARDCGDKGFDLEEAILRNFTKYAFMEGAKDIDSVWDQLAIGQHHGLPTRLLDWTYSPLTALHFATSGEPFSKMQEDDCVLWAIDIDEMNSLLPEAYRKKLRERKAHLFTVEMMDEMTGSIGQYDDDMHGDAMVLLEPPSIDQRIVNQYSYFSVTSRGMGSIEGFLEMKTSKTIKYVIDKSIKWRIRDMLDQLNINERIMYPGLDGIASWLKRRYYVKL